MDDKSRILKRFLFITVAFLFAINTFAVYYVWDSNVVAVYDFENNANDTLGNYNSTTIGSPYTLLKAYNGNYSATGGGTGATVSLSDNFQTYMSNYLTWTYSTYVWIPPNTPVTPFGAQDLCCHTGNFALSFGWGSTNALYCQFNSDWFLVSADWSAYTNKWTRVNIEKNNTTVYFYFDGNLALQTSSAVNMWLNRIAIPFGLNSLWFGQINNWTPSNLNGYTDYTIITKDRRYGAEITPIGIPETEVIDKSRLEFYDKSQMGY